MQPMHSVDGRTVRRTCGPPVVQAARAGETMGEPMRDAEAAAALQLRQHDDHLTGGDEWVVMENRLRIEHARYNIGTHSICIPLQWRHRVDRFQFAARRHHIVALLAVALDVDPFVFVPILNHHDETGPALYL